MTDDKYVSIPTYYQVIDYVVTITSMYIDIYLDSEGYAPRKLHSNYKKISYHNQ